MPMSSRPSDHAAAQADLIISPPRVGKLKTPLVVTKRLGYLNAELDELYGTMSGATRGIQRVNENLHLQENQGAAAEDLRKLRAKQTEARGRINALSRLQNEAAGYLKAAGMIQEVRSNVKIPEDEQALKDLIATTRSEISRAKAELLEVSRAPTKVVNLEQQVRAYVLALAAKGKPPIATITSTGQIKIEFSSPMEPGPLPVQLVAWQDPDKMIERLLKEVRERQAQTGRQALTEEERDERTAELKIQLDKLERKDVVLTEHAITRGVLGISFRADTAIAPFLGVKAVRNEPARTALASQ